MEFSPSVLSALNSLRGVFCLWYNLIMNYRLELDRVFSIYIRTLYANYKEEVTCFTCGEIFHWREIQCGHFILRSNSSTRYDKRNCRPQCANCNEFRNGMEESFEEQLRYDLGDKEFDELMELGKQPYSYSEDEYKELIHNYKLKIRQKGYSI